MTKPGGKPGAGDLKRISIIGVPGAGKTRLSRELVTPRPMRRVNADSYLWDSHWRLREPDPRAAFQAALRRGKRWIADSEVCHGPRELLQLPDLVIYLDYSMPRLVLHNIRRWLTHRKFRRPELPAGCEERFPRQILKDIVGGRTRRGHEEALRSYPPRLLVRIRTPRKLRAFVRDTFGPDGTAGKIGRLR